MAPDFWSVMFKPAFLITAGLVAAAFIPTVISILDTWKAGKVESRSNRS